MVHIYNRILLSHKKEWNNAICSDVDGPKHCYTEWTKPEKDKYIAYMWNLKKKTGMNGSIYKTEIESQM